MRRSVRRSGHRIGAHVHVPGARRLRGFRGERSFRGIQQGGPGLDSFDPRFDRRPIRHDRTAVQNGDVDSGSACGQRGSGPWTDPDRHAGSTPATRPVRRGHRGRLGSRQAPAGRGGSHRRSRGVGGAGFGPDAHRRRRLRSAVGGGAVRDGGHDPGTPGDVALRSTRRGCYHIGYMGGRAWRGSGPHRGAPWNVHTGASGAGGGEGDERGGHARLHHGNRGRDRHVARQGL